jgi:hypothetical protein
MLDFERIIDRAGRGMNEAAGRNSSAACHIRKVTDGSGRYADFRNNPA